MANIYMAVLTVVSAFAIVAIVWAAIGDAVTDCINSWFERHFPNIEE